MRLHRFIDNYDFSKKSVEIVDEILVNQIKNVLRMTHGGRFLLSDGKGIEAEVVITEIMPKSIMVDILNTSSENKKQKEVTLFLAILKKENFELAVQKAVECGVSKIVPFINERTIKTGLNMERLTKIIREASEQCGRNTLPRIFDPIDFKEALEAGKDAEEKIIFHLVEKEYTPHKNANTASIFVGAEGGFTDSEITIAKSLGYIPTSLGPLVLRAETAATIGTYKTVYNA